MKEFKQETLEEAAERLNRFKNITIPVIKGNDHTLAIANACYKEGVKAGSKWQQSKTKDLLTEFSKEFNLSTDWRNEILEKFIKKHNL